MTHKSMSAGLSFKLGIDSKFSIVYWKFYSDMPLSLHIEYIHTKT